MTDTKQAFAQWVILELMGHRRLAGYLTEAEIGGGSFLRLEIPADEPTEAPPWKATQYYSPASVYCITPTDEATARLCAKDWTEPPVTKWDLQRMLPERGLTEAERDDMEGERDEQDEQEF